MARETDLEVRSKMGAPDAENGLPSPFATRNGKTRCSSCDPLVGVLSLELEASQEVGAWDLEFSHPLLFFLHPSLLQRSFAIAV
jgi:hypothetical protein